MKAVTPPLHNITYGKGQPQYAPLPAYKDKNSEEGKITTCWELSDEEVLQLTHTKKVYLQVMTFNNPLQPVLLTVRQDEVYSATELDIWNKQESLRDRRE